MEKLKKVHSIIPSPNKKISDLLDEMARTGFQGRKLGEVVEVWSNMLNEDNLVIIFGYAGSLSTTGQWKIVKWLIENRFIDVLVATGANISEDIVEAMGGSYYQGSHLANDKELLRNDFNRYYDVYGSELEYRKMEDLIAEFIKDLDDEKIYSSMEFLKLFGDWLLERNIDCIVSSASKHKVPIFCPAIVDSAYGEAAILAKVYKKNLKIDQIKDFEQFLRIGEKCKKSGVIYIGGGVPKDFSQLMAVSLGFLIEDVKDKKSIKHGNEFVFPHKYAIQITVDSPQWGGLSGCTLEEAISWGKVDEEGKFVTCYCDATIALPIVVHALIEKVRVRKSYPDLSWLLDF